VNSRYVLRQKIGLCIRYLVHGLSAAINVLRQNLGVCIRYLVHGISAAINVL